MNRFLAFLTAVALLLAPVPVVELPWQAPAATNSVPPQQPWQAYFAEQPTPQAAAKSTPLKDEKTYNFSTPNLYANQQAMPVLPNQPQAAAKQNDMLGALLPEGVDRDVLLGLGKMAYSTSEKALKGELGTTIDLGGSLSAEGSLNKELGGYQTRLQYAPESLKKEEGKTWLELRKPNPDEEGGELYFGFERRF